MALEGRAAQQRFPHRDAGYKAEFEEPEEEGLRESLLCTEQLVPDENLMTEVGAESSLGSMDHTAILGDPAGKILKREGSPEVSKEEADGEYYLGCKPESPLAPLMSLDSHPLAFYQPSHLAACFSNVDADPPVSETEPSQELVLPSESEEKVDPGSLPGIKKETTQKKKRGSPNPPCVGLQNEQNPEVNQNLSPGPPTRRSARCAPANNVGQPSFGLSSGLLSKGSAHGIQERRASGLLEISKESVAPARKKTRTFYNAKQRQELEKTFQEDHYPDNKKRQEIAASVGVMPQRILVWFQNRRAKWKKTEKLKAKSSTKSSVGAPAVPVVPQQVPQGKTVLAGTQLSDAANNQPSTVTMHTATGNYSGPPISLSTSSAASVTSSKTSCYASIQTKAPAFQGSLGSLREELFPSPPPIRRARLPFNVVLNSDHHIIPLMLDDSLPSKRSPSSQESSSSDALTFSIQSQSTSLPLDCNYSEQLEPTINLEASCFHPNSHPGVHQHGQYSQHEVSHFPIHLSGNTVPGVRLTTATPSKSTTYFSIPGSNGLVTYGAAECSQGFLPYHVGTHLLQPSAGSSGYLPAFQTFQWNEFSTQGPSFTHSSSSSSSPIPLSGLAVIGGSSAQQAPFAPNQTLPANSCLLQLPKAPGPGATLVFTTRPLVPMNLEPPSQLLPKMLAEEDSEHDNGPQEMEALPDFSKDSKIGLTFSPHQDEKTA